MTILYCSVDEELIRRFLSEEGLRFVDVEDMMSKCELIDQVHFRTNSNELMNNSTYQGIYWVKGRISDHFSQSAAIQKRFC